MMLTDEAMVCREGRVELDIIKSYLLYINIYMDYGLLSTHWCGNNVC